MISNKNVNKTPLKIVTTSFLSFSSLRKAHAIRALMSHACMGRELNIQAYITY